MYQFCRLGVAHWKENFSFMKVDPHALNLQGQIPKLFLSNLLFLVVAMDNRFKLMMLFLLYNH